MKIKLLALLFLTSLGFSDTTTNRLGLTVPTIGSPNWGPKINGDMQIIDAAVAGQASSNTYTLSNTFNGLVVFNAGATWNNLQTGTGECLGVDASSHTVYVPCGSGGGGSTNGTIVPSPQNQIPFYSLTGSSNVLTGNSNITTDNSGDLTMQGDLVVNGSRIAGHSFEGTEGTFGPNGLNICGSSGCVEIFSPSSVTGGSYTLTLSSSQGGANTFLKNDGSGNLSWAAQGGGGSGSGIVSPGTFTWVNNFGISASTITVSTLTVQGLLTVSTLTVSSFINTPVFINQPSLSGSPTSELRFKTTGALLNTTTLRKFFYTDYPSGILNNPFWIDNNGSKIKMDELGAVGINELQYGTTFYVSGNVEIGSGAISTGTTLAPTDGLYVKGASIFNSTATVAALSFSGGGNAQFSNDGSNYYQLVGSSATATAGHLAVFSSSWSVVDGGVPAASATPSGGNFDVQVSSNGAFGGADNLQNNGSTVTVSNVGLMVETNVSSQVAAGVYFDYTASTMTEPSLLGRTAGSTPSSGMIGQYVSSSVVSAVSFPSTTNYGDLASISLTAGDWDISAVLGSQANGGTVTTMSVGISSTTGNSSAGLVEGDSLINALGPTAATDTFGSIPNFHAFVTTTTTYYLKFKGAFSVATPKAVGRLSARRVS